jgi:hypothetical protein
MVVKPVELPYGLGIATVSVGKNDGRLPATMTLDIMTVLTS